MKTTYLQLVKQAKELCEKFVKKVETGKARSVETYADCKSFLNRMQGMKDEKPEPFSNLIFPERPDLKISDFQHIEIDPNTRIYFRPEEDDSDVKTNGFKFYAVGFACCSGSSSENVWECEDLEVECLFWGQAYWDGLKHLYMGDQQTDSGGYLCYPDLGMLSAVFVCLKKLEDKYCPWR